MHVIKIGDLYLTADGSWSPRQADALRVSSDRTDGGQVDSSISIARTVKLRPRSRS